MDKYNIDIIRQDNKRIKYFSCYKYSSNNKTDRVLFSSMDFCSHFSPRRCLIGFNKFTNQVVEVSAAIFWHRRKVASLSVFFIIDCLVVHPVRGLFPAQYLLRRPTRGALAAHSQSFEMPKSRTVQFSRSFVLSCVRLWIGLQESICFYW